MGKTLSFLVIIILIFVLPVTSLAQKDEIFAKFISDDGSLIKGSSMVRLYERQIPLSGLETSSASKSTVVRLTMNNESASAVFRNLQLADKRMRSGEITVTFLSLDRRLVRYKINMENIAVEEYSDSQNSCIIQLHATRIGWTYYSYTKSGIQTISSKIGWDEELGTSWSGF